MKRIFIIAGLGMLSMGSYAQQIPQYSQYLRNQFMVNPAAAGVYDFVDITLCGRSQWSGFDGAPKTAYLSVASLITKKPRVLYNPAIRTSTGPVRNPEIKTGKLKHALGGQLLVDQYGAFTRQNAALTYAIHLPMSKNYNLSFGTRVGLSNNVFDQSKAQVLNVIDNSLGYNDPTYDLYLGNSSNKFIMDIGAGFYLYSKKLFLGISADHLSKDFVEFGSGTANFNTQLHMNATLGYKFPLNDNLTMMPAVLVKYMKPAPVSIDASLQFEYKEWLWAGVSYRHTDAVIGMLGMNINRMFKLGYSYDFSISRFNDFSAGGHELVLGIMLGRGK
ncbi:MAG: type IX secretion system membrane protein PorP/SprF [Bacteroidota bacterium]